MQKKLPALFIGRFQPLHLGHLDAISQILENESSVVICIGSSQSQFEPANPFTAIERTKMLRAAIKEKKLEGHVAKIVAIPDINDDSRWVKHVTRLCQRFGRVHTGSKIVRGLFEKDGTHKVAPLRIRKKISATKIREMMLEGGPWKKLIPGSTAKLLVSWAAVSRVKEIDTQRP